MSVAVFGMRARLVVSVCFSIVDANVYSVPDQQSAVVVSAAGLGKTDPPDVLDRQKCLTALAEQRRTKWFQARVSSVQSCLVILRLMRDICKRISLWNVISDWMLELLVEKCIMGYVGFETLSPANALRRVFECVASGILLNGSPGLLDPCEKESVDVVLQLTNQQREDITSSAQQAVRLIAFRQVHRLLGVSSNLDGPIPVQQPSRKRPYSESFSPSIGDGEKKEKQV